MTRLSASRMACSTRPNLLRISQRAIKKKPSSVRPVSTNSVMRMLGVAMGRPRMRLKSVKPLLPPKPVSLRKNSSMAAKVMAWVMIEKYTPLMRERKAKKPNTRATRPGTSTISKSVATKLSDSAQCQGSAFQSRNTMKSGRSLL